MATQHGDTNKEPKILKTLEQYFDGLGKMTQFFVLVGGVFLFFGVHNLLQETMMAIDGFNFGIMLGYMEVFGYVSFVVCCCRRRRWYLFFLLMWTDRHLYYLMFVFFGYHLSFEHRCVHTHTHKMTHSTFPFP